MDQNFRTFVLALGLGVTLLGCNPTSGIDEGLAAANKGDFTTALRIWKPLADKGVAFAQSNLGMH